MIWIRAALLALLLTGTVGAEPPPPPGAPPGPPPLVYVGVNAFGAEEWQRTKDGALVIRVPGGPFLRRPYEGREATAEPKPVEWGPFLVDKHEVTNEQFARFVDLNRTEADSIELTSRGGGGWWRLGVPGLTQDAAGVVRAAPGWEQHPVTAATGFGALAYAQWVGARLPTAAEWEKAASGADARLWPWGNEPPSPLFANYGLPEARGTRPVGSYAAGASPFGALDMAGNVYERVYGDDRPERDALRPPVVIKGGSWLSPHPLNLRVFDMCVQDMRAAEGSVGFRCVMDDPEPSRPAPKPEARPRLTLATSFDSAVKEARERHVPIFLAQLVDTCGQCDRVRAQVFRDPRFVEYANQHLVVIVGHHPGDAQLDPHPEGPDGACPLYPGLTCDQHLLGFVRGQEVVGAFQGSPGMWVLHPDHVEKGAGPKAVLISEARFPKNGTGVEVFLAAFDEARKLLAAEAAK